MIPFRKQRHDSTLSDEKLMALVQKGSEDALSEIYRRYSKRLLVFFFRMLGNDEEIAQDFLQDLFLKIAEKPHLFHTGKCFSTWIFAVAHNMCKNEYRQRKNRNHVESWACLDSLAAAEQFATFEQEIIHEDLKEIVLSELGKMDERKRATFLLRYQEHFSIKEISQVMQCSEGTVKSRLFYTTRYLTEKFKSLKQEVR